MYRTCIYCHRDLGDNEFIENFPIGRGLAFDQEKGRLWVVCEKCRRWNLSPLTERWEAIEECEKLYRDTFTRFSTDQIGLARLADGTRLIRVGKPQRPELAAWRYARRLAGRWWGGFAKDAAAAALDLALLLGGAFVGMALFHVSAAWRSRAVVARVTTPDGEQAIIRARDLPQGQLHPSTQPGGFALTMSYTHEFVPWWKFKLRHSRERRALRVYGQQAIHTAGALLPRYNAYGGFRRQIRDAVGMIEEAGSASRLFASVPDGTPRRTWLNSMPIRHRLALEMAAHEDSERRAMEGELARLEEDWREAEEIAAISDRLLIPNGSRSGSSGTARRPSVGGRVISIAYISGMDILFAP